jgi:hypothetical protein
MKLDEDGTNARWPLWKGWKRPTQAVTIRRAIHQGSAGLRTLNTWRR